ncbi:hypothetical protein [Variovorax sp. RCC_210]|uniref:hypothetical protein n=1 Tax=Variovorax sp. RCC_210 TaxID=3239217 RepID=UPI00352649BA
MAVRSVPIGSLAPGLNNRLEPTQLDTALPNRRPATYLYAADNVDINAKGYLKRRRGQTTAISGRAHSIWSTSPFSEAFAVINGNLERLRDGGADFTRVIVRPNMPQLPVSFSRGADNAVYWSNGVTLRRVINGEDRPAVTDALDTAPLVAVGKGEGSLRAGRYLVAFTRTGPDGESAATPIVQLQVPEGSAISWSASDVVNVFLSAPNGEILIYQTLGLGGSVPVHTQSGRECDTLNLAPMPPGTIVRHYKGRMLVVSGNLLFYSLPYQYGVYDPASGYLAFAEPISVVEVVDGGIFIAADKTYALADLVEGQLVERLPYGAIPFTSGTLPRSKQGSQVFWQSVHGLVIGNPDLSLANVQEDALDVPSATAGATLFRDRDGLRQIIATRTRVEPSVAVASSYMEAEIMKKGTFQ